MIRKLLFASALLVAAPLAQAASCSAVLEGNDAMKFNLTDIPVDKSCTTFTLTLKHTGKLGRSVMGHNVVVTKSADLQAVNADGMKAGLANEYVKPGDARVIAASKVIGGGETTTLAIPVAKLKAAPGPYSFFCSFPGHATLMKGTLTLK
ncbi:azurin [Pseudoxanthomonas mexicana]|uniref:azurin n=1 Tax=Pseudoxanthomonas mexicana TaxID=128785 RepID=UPI00398AF72A